MTTTTTTTMTMTMTMTMAGVARRMILLTTRVIRATHILTATPM
jgi:hypothetical protein